jgi:diguanylate cyclase (GGDEF)-like protein
VFDQKCLAMDIAENYPLSIMIADVNDLKEINDSLGHKYGDDLLCIVARTIMRLRPENAVLARIGGDEFALIVPHCTGEEITAMVLTLKELLKQEGNKHFTPSVALGTTTKTHIGQDLKKLINDADKNMYQQKDYYRNRKLLS